MREDLPAWVAAAAAAGFDAYSPDCLSLAAWRARGETVASLATQIADAGLGCDIVAACGVLDGSETVVAQLRNAAQDALHLGSRFLQVNCAAATPAARRDAIAAACEAIDNTGLRLAIEYMPFTPLCSLAETAAICAEVGFHRAGALIDIWHHAHDPNGWEALTRVPLAAIAYVEFNDALPGGNGDLAHETMERRTMPGKGILPCARFADTLLARGYQGWVSIEVLNGMWRDRPPMDFARACLATSRSFWGGIAKNR